jgi:hypothetical protein
MSAFCMSERIYVSKLGVCPTPSVPFHEASDLIRFGCAKLEKKTRNLKNLDAGFGGEGDDGHGLVSLRWQQSDDCLKTCFWSA